MHSLNWVRHIFSAMFGVRTSLKWPQCQRFLCSKPSDIEVAQLEFVQTKQQRSNHVRYSDTKIDWDAEMCEVFGEEREQNNARSVLAPVNDESKFYAEPMLRPTYHLAAYVNKSATLQRLIRLGVNLDYLERRKMAQLVAQLDFDRDVKEHVRFLTRVVGLEIDEIGLFLTKNPHILEQSLDDLQTRVNYLRAKKFQPQDITRIIRLNRRWLNHSTKEIDARLASFQIMFELSGDEVRAMAIAGPKVITEQQQQIREASFSLKEECCFEADEAKDILLKCPSVWMLRKSKILFKLYFDGASYAIFTYFSLHTL